MTTTVGTNVISFFSFLLSYFDSSLLLAGFDSFFAATGASFLAYYGVGSSFFLVGVLNEGIEKLDFVSTFKPFLDEVPPAILLM